MTLPHTAIWYLYNDAKLSATAALFIDGAAAAGSQVAVSAISLVEIIYLIEKKRIPPGVYSDLKTALEDAEHVFAEAPLTADIVEAMRQVSRDEIPDMPDRIVAATAVNFGVPAISRDGRIRGSNIKTIW